MFIYAIRNRDDLSKCLIGQTIQSNPERRWSMHRCLLKKGKHRNSHLQSAWDKYGEDKYEFVVLTKADNQTDLDKLEWIYEKMFGYYNMKEGGRGGKLSEEVKKKISMGRKGKGLGQIPWNKGIPRTDETKEKISKANGGRIFSAEVHEKWSKMRKGKSNPFYGKKHTQSSLEKMSNSHKGVIPWNKGLTLENGNG